MIANIITIARIPFSLCLLLLSPSSVAFAGFYSLCGVSDVLDGFLARKLHTESKAGERLDSIADLFFAVAYAVKILPLLRVPVWILIWIVWIAAIKIFGIFIRGKKEQRFYIPHSILNKLTGIFVFLLPMTVYWIEVKYSASVVCTVATFAAMAELLNTRKC